MSAVTAGAQPAVTATLANVTRVDSWSYFQPYVDPRALPPQPAGDPDYTFVGDRAELGVRVEGSRFDLGGAFNYVRLENLPKDAIGPGGLGDGAFYFAATGVSYSYQLYFGELTLRVKSSDQRSSFTIGRMPFTSGARLRQGSGEARPVDRLVNERIASRLIGNFEWSLYQRRFDGVRFDLERNTWDVTGAVFVPTQGGYEESTNLSMPDIQIASGSYARRSTASDFQVFGYLYHDRRETKAVVDNTGRPDQQVDITMATFGGSYARVTPTTAGELDAVAWGAIQTGDWYGFDHLAGSVVIEGGHRWTRAWLRPRLRAGYLWASGDGDRSDSRHHTFFQMLPSSRQYALSSVYAQMNLSDAFAEAQIEPGRLRARIAVHAVHLANGGDLWYQGSGATATEGRYFGFAGRTAGGYTSLGSVIEGTFDVPIIKHWSVNGYLGLMTAGDAVRRQYQFTDKSLKMLSFENVIRF